MDPIRRQLTLGCAATACIAVPAAAQEGWPSRPINYIVPFAPAGTPQPAVDRVAREAARMIRDPEFNAKLGSLGVETSGAVPADLAAFQQPEMAKWARLIKTAGVRPE